VSSQSGQSLSLRRAPGFLWGAPAPRVWWHLEELEEHVEDRDYEVPGQFTFEGRTWQVQSRYRGRSTRFEPKKPWHVSFDKDGGYLTE
jgi:hypothetical protein